ncbi:MAG: Three-deoxy-D-manno-octulosonic-acid transferase protein [Ferruginibacter sp.]|nr:Three-deoxy-D-manno-octulosonic-acid transferase protein [Ferruginibacter sp.]
MFKKLQLGKIIYNIFLALYSIGFQLVALFNNKARLGVKGRRHDIPRVANPNRQLVWMHCASLGEFEQGRPVLESLKQQYPGISIALTFFSASGYEVMKNYKGADHIFYLPIDSSSGAKRLVDALNPTLVLWVKYEFWYYYLEELKRRNIPVLLLSGIFRKSHPFFQWYGGLWREMLHCFSFFFVQNESSANLLATLGLHENILVTGDTRFDRVIEIAERFEALPLIEKFCGDSKILVAGSTWEDDEAELIHYVKANPQIKLIIAPHEIDTENLKDVKKEFVNTIFYSELQRNEQSPGSDEKVLPNVLIIDNVGMLSRLYAYGDITYVGGGFGADGVHNVLEAAVYGKPVIFGPEFEKYAEAVGLVESGGGITIANALELESVLNGLWENESLLNDKGASAKNYVYSNAGASNKIIRVIQEKRLLTN